jgi:hypothetical protein
MRAFDRLTAGDPEKIDGFGRWQLRFSRKNKIPVERGGHAALCENIPLVSADGMSGVTSTHRKIKQPAKNGLLANEGSIDLAVERANEIELVAEKRAEKPQGKKPSGPSHDNNPVGFLFAQNCEDTGYRAQHFRDPASVKFASVSDFDALKNNVISLSGVSRCNGDIVIGDCQLACQQSDLELGAARGALLCFIENPVRVA